MNLNYYDTFITVSRDCPAERGLVPQSRKAGKTKPEIEYELLLNAPYVYTQEQLLYEVHLRHKEVPEAEIAARGDELREAFFAQPKPCLRASMLPKKYGWGLHFNGEGKMALVPMESPEYRHFVDDGESGVKLVPAMSNKRI